MIEKEEFKNKINSVVEHIKGNDVTNATSELLGLIDDYNQGFDELTETNTKYTEANTKNTELNSKIEQLKNVNMDLLLKVGSQKVDEPTINKPTDQQEDKPLKFEDLFDEKGEIKS